MRISHSKKFIFLANPRTASTSLRSVLDPHSDIKSRLVSDLTNDFPFYHHITARELEGEFRKRGWEWENYQKFCVVRNPFERIVSLYNHQQKIYKETSSPSRYFAAIGEYGFVHATKMCLLYLIRPKSFSEFVKRIDPKKSLTISIQNFTFDESGKSLVEYYVRFESLEHDLPEVLAKFGIEITKDAIPKLNSASREKPLEEFYGEEEIALMKEYYGYEIEKFGYEPK